MGPLRWFYANLHKWENPNVLFQVNSENYTLKLNKSLQIYINKCIYLFMSSSSWWNSNWRERSSSVPPWSSLALIMMMPSMMPWYIFPDISHDISHDILAVFWWTKCVRVRAFHSALCSQLGDMGWHHISEIFVFEMCICDPPTYRIDRYQAYKHHLKGFFNSG